MSNCKECIIASVGLTGKKDCQNSCPCSCHEMTLHDIEILEIHNKIEKIQKDVILIKKYLDRQDVQLDSWYQRIEVLEDHNFDDDSDDLLDNNYKKEESK